MPPLISVIITAYNKEAYIEKCIRSALCENCGIEIIAVDDCSADKTAEIIKSFGGAVKLVSLPKNSGSVAKTRSIGLEKASGEYITFLDADDSYAPGALPKIAEYIEKTRADIIKFGYDLEYPGGKTTAPDLPYAGGIVKKPEFKEKVYPLFINGITLNSVCLAVFRREIAQKAHFPENFKTAEDAGFCLLAYTAAKTVFYTKDRLYRYYQSGSGLTGGGLSIFKKYKYNFLLSGKILSLLGGWGLDTPKMRLKTVLRPAVLTFNKLKRLEEGKCKGKNSL